MKNVTVVILMFMLTHLSVSQTMTVHKKNQTTVDFPFSQIDSITFSVQDTSPADTGVIFPLKIGNWWKYIVRSLDTNGVTIGIDSMVLSISRDSMVAGERWYFLEVNGSFYGEIMTNRIDGVWYANPSEPIPVLLAKYPASVNDTFIGIGSQNVTVLSMDENIGVPLGSFSCYKYEERAGVSGPVNFMRYFSRGIGMVRDDWYSTVPTSDRRFVFEQRELMSMSLNNADVIPKRAGNTTARSARFFFSNK